VELIQVDDLRAVDWSRVAGGGGTTVLASNARARYGEYARAWRPDLHLVLWNPFQALDVPAPTIVTWGYADGALDALRAWLEGRGNAPGRAPVPIAPP
jgi:beta-N-acetylhexosaminidase